MSKPETNSPIASEILETPEGLVHIRSGLQIKAFIVCGKTPTDKQLKMSFAADASGYSGMQLIKIREPQYFAILEGGEQMPIAVPTRQ